MAEQIAKDPAFNQMAQQLQSSIHSVGNDSVPQLDTNQYINAMQQVMQNPQFMTMAERLGNALMQADSLYILLFQLHCCHSSYEFVLHIEPWVFTSFSHSVMQSICSSPITWVCEL